MNKHFTSFVTAALLASSSLVYAQSVGIGTNTPNPSAKLHIVDANRGLLIPQLSLVNINNAAPVTTPATGLLVWNNNATVLGGGGAGFYYWNGAQWDKLSTGPGTDDQNLTGATLSGNNLTITIENGNPTTVDLSGLVNDADAVIGNEYNTGFALSGNNLTITDGGGPRTVNLAGLNESGRNGLRNVGNFIHLGGSLIENTNVSAGTFNMNFNLDNTGDFNIQDNGVNKFTVLDNGTSRFGGDVQWRDANTGGILLANLIDDGDDGRFTVRENGIISVDLDANTQFIFNQQGLDRNFRIESDNNANMFFLDAGTNRIGVGTGAPSEALHVVGTARMTTGAIVGDPAIRGSYLMAVGSAAPAIQLGNMAFNNAESGRLTFEENTPNYTANIADYCGFQIHHNGDANTLAFGSDCGTNINIMTLERAGDVGIATNNPTADLSVNGTANKTGGGNWAVFSDARLKKNISDYKEGLSLITRVRTVNFSYNDKMAEIWGEDERNKDRVYQGVIAQELQAIAPDMVREVQLQEEANPEDHDAAPATPTEEESYLEVDPNKFTYALINAVKEQQAMIEAQQAQIDELKAKMKALEESKK